MCVYLRSEGKTLSLTEWSKEKGIPLSTLSRRKLNNEDVDSILNCKRLNASSVKRRRRASTKARQRESLNNFTIPEICKILSITTPSAYRFYMNGQIRFDNNGVPYIKYKHTVLECEGMKLSITEWSNLLKVRRQKLETRIRNGITLDDFIKGLNDPKVYEVIRNYKVRQERIYNRRLSIMSKIIQGKSNESCNIKICEKDFIIIDEKLETGFYPTGSILCNAEKDNQVAQLYIDSYNRCEPNLKIKLVLDGETISNKDIDRTLLKDMNSMKSIVQSHLTSI